MMVDLFGNLAGREARCVRAVRLIVIALSWGIMTIPAGAGEADAPLGSLWRFDPSIPTAEVRQDGLDEISDLVTQEDAVALALQANHLVKSRERLQLIAETTRRAYGDVVQAYRSLAVREERLKAAMGVERLVAEMARQGKATPSDVLHAQAALTRVVQDVQEARAGFAAQTRQLNHLMGRDLQTRMRVRPGPDATPSATVRGGSAAVRGE
jgi:outer membrane protein TolC